MQRKNYTKLKKNPQKVDSDDEREDFPLLLNIPKSDTISKTKPKENNNYFVFVLLFVLFCISISLGTLPKGFLKCKPTSCLNGGICSTDGITRNCECTSFWTGRKCEIDVDECLITNFCNNGICNNNIWVAIYRVYLDAFYVYNDV